MSAPLRTVPGGVAKAGDIPRLDLAALRDHVVRETATGARISALFGVPGEDGSIRLVAVLSRPDSGTISLASADVRGSYPSLTPDCSQAHHFEREVAEVWGVRPEGHPWLKPIRFQPPARPARAKAPELPGVTRFFQVHGEEVHEVAVGPVHAGIIEPGHFRFQCRGEEVLHLEISLGYQHRGVEKALAGGPGLRTLHLMETLAGDTTVGHATAYCEAVEALGGCRVPPRALAIRGIALELERLANHTGDLGALAGDIGYLPTAAHCGRIRGDFLNMTALICGNRFGRGILVPGGVRFDLDPERAGQLIARVDRALADAAVAVNLLWEDPSVMARFEETGTVSPEICRALGLVGPAARACGVEEDVRQDFPSGIYRFAHIPISTWDSGDVFARAYVRWLEIQRSAAFVHAQARALPDGPIRAEVRPPAPDSVATSLIEGWRGEICHVALTDARGRFRLYKVVDPSFHNWMGLALALRGQQISDFPLCNKSFNLSYCGHDL
jgi:Ni,Fe-hydrogenase III large subunit